MKKAARSFAAAALLATVRVGAMAHETAGIPWQLDLTARVDAFHATRGATPSDRAVEGIGQFKGTVSFSPDTQWKFDARAATAHGDSRWLESYVEHRFEGAELRVGRQVMAWGRADGVNPTDNLSPRDFKTWLPFDDDQRFGVWALRADLHPARVFDLTLVASPWFEGSEIPAPAGLPSSRAPMARNAGNATFAAKLNRAGEAMDWSLSYLRGPALLPGARLADLPSQGGPRLEFHHDHVQVLGADIARNVGRFGLRGEVAWTWPDGSDDGTAAQRRRGVAWVVGIDRSFVGNLYVNVQLFGRHVNGDADPAASGDPAQRAVAVQNAITFGQQDRDSLGYTVRVSDKWLGDTLEAEVLLVSNRTRENAYLRSMLAYAVDDRLKVLGGAVLYSGAPETVFGRKRPTNRLFVELRYAL